MIRPTLVAVKKHEPRPGQVWLAHVGALVRLARPRQWIKNLLVWAALLFSGELFSLQAVGQTLLVFCSFCLVSSAVYCLNDMLDAPFDRLHPQKRFRPVASGLITPVEAIGAALGLAMAGLALEYFAHPAADGVLLLYLFVNLLYSLWLKQVVLLDIMAVASGFLLRAVGGAVAIDVGISRWFLFSVLLLSLFLATVKRRHEVSSSKTPMELRRVLAEYPLQLLDAMISVFAGASIITYLFYAMEAARPPLFVVTSGFVFYGVFRYLYLVYRRGGGGNPEEPFLRDRPLLTAVSLWALSSAVILYGS
ncbi:MAG: decaprenyl-phosphate phosphoribosyltransferase [Mycobacterium leprae]